MSPQYRGRWRREWLEAPPSPIDRSTEVTWLQASRLYCDLRIPAGRPDFSQRRTLADCTDAELAWLATQQGFAGHLEVAHDLCYWHRHFDFQAPTGLPDAGRMNWTAARVFETGLFAQYEESWIQMDTSADDLYAAKLYVCASSPTARAVRQGMLVVVGNTFMFALERAIDPAKERVTLESAFRDGTREALLQALDCEISLGERVGDGAPWQIRHSTLPFLEGEALFHPEDLRCTGLIPPHPRRVSLRDAVCHWQVDECGPAFRWEG